MFERLRRCAASLAACTLFAAAPAWAGDVVFESDFDHAPEGPYNAREASRFLAQATFGPTPAEIQRLKRIGYNAWLAEQQSMPVTLHRPYLVAIDQQNGANTDVSQGDRTEAFGYRALTAPDQLRQRVAYALSQIFVVSDDNDTLANYPYALARWHDFLLQNAFGNYRTFLEATSKSPVMGVYLSHLGNQKPDPENNIRPDENYAREILQLFSVGLVRLNADGTVFDGDSSAPGVQPSPTYDQDTIRGFAHVFTGWNYARCELDQYTWCGPGDDGADLETPMVAFPSFHASEGTKQLLVYPGAAGNGVLAAGGTAQSDLTAALNNIFAHPNVGPFLSRLLIQRLTTSNPTPAYVQRVAAVFTDDNGAQAGGARGNLGAVVRAILLDPEARSLTNAPPYSGKLREPQLRMTSLLRALDGRADTPNRYDDWRLRYPYYFQGQAALESPTVFNFYLPSYTQRGELATNNLVAPEFQILTDGYLTLLSNELAGLAFWTWRGNEWIEPEALKIDLNPYYVLSDNPQALVDRFDTLLMGGRMTKPMNDILVAHLNSIDFPWGRDDQRRLRVQDLIWLISVSPEGVIER